MSAIVIRLILAPILLLTLSATATETQSKDTANKVNLLLQVSKFIDWPTTLVPQSPIKLCLFATTPGKEKWNRIHQQISQNHPIQLQYINQDSQIPYCNMLFVHKDISNDVIQKNYYALISNKILTIGERKNFAKEGGMIELRFIENAIDIKINLQTATAAGISIHANLTEIASTVFTLGQD